MYTIIINDDKSLTTSVKTTLLKGTTTDQIQFLYKDPNAPSDPPETNENSVSDEEQQNPQVTVEKVYMALLRYETDDIMKTESLATDTELYKERVRFILPRSAAFFRNRGVVQLWLEIHVETTTTTTTTVIDPISGEEVTETTTEVSNETFTTLPTTLFMEEVPYEKHCPCRPDDNAIIITRGDSQNVIITLTDDDGFPYVPVEGDTILFTMKKSAAAETVLIQKEININTLTISFVESDTENYAFGNYVYEVEVITAQNDHYTVIKNAPFIITEELH